MGKPKKNVLLLCASEYELARQRFVLSTHGYRVLSALTAATARERLRDCADLRAVVADAALTTNELLAEARRLHPFVAMIVIGAPEQMADLHSDGGMPSFAATEVLWRLKLLTVKKRGPRAGAKKAVQRVVPAAMDVQVRGAA
jgi:hypothetical protein